MNQNMSVLDKMGQVSLSFMWMSNDRTRYRYTNDDVSSETHSKWKKLKGQMGRGNFFCVATVNTPSPTKSGGTYSLLGVLCTFADFDEMQHANALYWDALQNCSNDFEKLQVTADFSNVLNKWFEREDCMKDFNINTHLLLQLCAEGNLKEAKKIAKEFM